MPYRGHIENGVVVLDDPVPFPEGTEVTVEPVRRRKPAECRFALRDTPYHFDDPFAPVVPPEDWDSSQ